MAAHGSIPAYREYHIVTPLWVMMARSDTTQELRSDVSSMLLNEHLERKRPNVSLAANHPSEQHTLQGKLPARFEGVPEELDCPNRIVATVTIMAVLNNNPPDMFQEIVHARLLTLVTGLSTCAAVR